MAISEKLIESVVSEVVEQIKSKAGTDGYRFSVPIGISNRHIHLSLKDMEILFGKGYELKKIKDLKQTGEFACEEKVTIVNIINGNEKSIEAVRILGPLREATQVEISMNDARKLKLNPPVRNSGELDGSEPVRLVGPNGYIDLKQGCIIASRHIHLSPIDAQKTGLKSGQIVDVAIRGEKPGIIGNVQCKVKDSFVFEIHLDTDDGNAFLQKDGDIAEILTK